ncbi:MAG: HAD family hydrolase [Anaerolineae bacterium]|jgi:putative hydrolase of the HAD superfamily
MTIRGVILDLGHTLMTLKSTWPDVFLQGRIDLTSFLHEKSPDLDGEAFAQTFLDRRAAGFARAKETLREVTAEDSMRWTFARLGRPDPDLALVHGAIDAFFAFEETCWTANPEALPVLEALADRGLQLGMFSNATHDPLIQRLVDHFGFRAWLDPALSSAATGIRKPDPAAFAPILAAWGLPPESVVMVGDTLDADILGAQRARMRSVWFPTREDARQEGNGSDLPVALHRIVPDAQIERLAELPSCLDTL